MGLSMGSFSAYCSFSRVTGLVYTSACASCPQSSPTHGVLFVSHLSHFGGYVVAAPYGWSYARLCGGFVIFLVTKGEEH